MALLVNCIKYLEKKIIPIPTLNKLFQKIEEELKQKRKQN
jgi:hypothetical protein